MSEPKPFASLSSGLLARKGSAKPAMRPQGFGGHFGGLEDLGWNDMGHAQGTPGPAFPDEPQEHVPSSIAALTPAPKPQDSAARDSGDAEPAEVHPAPEAHPAPVVQQRAIAESFSASLAEVDEVNEVEEVAPPVALAPTPRPSRAPRRAPGVKDKAAFTLRLDPDRHLKLRLACAVKHRSAQQLVSQALDEYLKRLPELDALARQVPADAGNQN